MSYKTNTRILNAGRRGNKHHGVINPAIVRGSTVTFNSVAAYQQELIDKNNNRPDALTYGLHGTQTTFDFEAVVADLEHGYASLAVSSGLAAITTALLAFVKQGDHILVTDTAYGPTRTFCDSMLHRMGVSTTYYDPMIGADIESLLQPNTRIIFLESPGSLTFEVQDVPAITTVAKRHHIVTILDNTWGAPLYYQPLDHGVDVSVVAATKYIIGHSDAMLGVISCHKALYPALRQSRSQLGQGAGPDDLYLALRGIRTLAVRLPAHQQQALDLANWLQQQAVVSRILHPAFTDCPGHKLWQRDFSGSCGLFSIELLPGSEQAVAAMVDSLQLFALGVSWGGYLSLVMPVQPQTMRSATRWDGYGPIIRLHAGLEAIDDLLEDLEQALRRYNERR